jgi:hypothetical protein
VFIGESVSPVRIILHGSTGNLTWKLNDIDISTLTSRAWYFTRSHQSTKERLATIRDDGNPKIRQSSLSGVEIVKPATLLLKNVNQSYDGVYQFSLIGYSVVAIVDITVFIAGKYQNRNL